MTGVIFPMVQAQTMHVGAGVTVLMVLELLNRFVQIALSWCITQYSRGVGRAPDPGDIGLSLLPWDCVHPGLRVDGLHVLDAHRFRRV